MTTYLALIRGINVGGHKLLAMADLRDLLARLGFEGCRSLLQSGNLVFQTGSRASAALERLLEAECRSRLSVEADFLVRTASEWKAVVEANPFRAEAERDPARLAVVFLKSAPASADVKALEAAIVGPERVRADGRQAYIVYPDGMGSSKLTLALIERKLRTRGTARNWNTVRKLAALAAP